MKPWPTILAAVAIAPACVAAVPTWPSVIDEMEDIMFLNNGYRKKGFSEFVTPCSKSNQGPGRVTAAEWLRTAFHDMATFNTNGKVGGVDGSIMYETNRGENIGASFNSSLQNFAQYFTRKSSVADLITLGVYTSVRACGGPVVQTRVGRVDALTANDPGVPVPSDGFSVFVTRFFRMGVNVTEMIQMTACGHTIGGVHSANFPEIVPVGTAANDFATFDNTQTFDNKVITDYLANKSTDPLVVGAARGSRSDLAVFAGDNNVTVRAMADPSAFSSKCATILQRMVEIVPGTVTLSDPLQPYEVKPYALSLTLLSGGTQMTFSGDVRIRTTNRAASSISKVEIQYKDRTGGTNCGSCIITATIGSGANGFDDTFQFYSFSATLSTTTSISSFIVLVTLNTGSVETWANNGGGYPVQDSIILQKPLSCWNSGTGALTVVAAVRNTVTSGTVNVDLNAKVPRSAIVPALQTTSLAMTLQSTLGPYSLYSLSYTTSSLQDGNTKFDVSTGTGASKLVDEFKGLGDLPATCATAPPTATTSSSSSSTTPTSTPTASNKSIIGSYRYNGCRTDDVGARTLTGGTTFSDTMTNEQCALICNGFTYFGTEFSRECYCGNAFGTQSNSSLAADSDCNMLCTGTQYEFCGGPNRLTLYKIDPTLVSSSAAPTQTAPAIKPTVSAYHYVGCRTDSQGARTLNSVTADSQSMTLEKCASLCSGYEYFGTEYGRECYCGNAIQASSPAPDSDCSFTCAGDNLEFCGAGNRLSLYAL